MKKNGFTLIELLGTIAILAALIIIITPKIFKHFQTTENITEQEQVNTFIDTARLYMGDNSELLPPENGVKVITISELKTAGLIKTNQVLNPKTREELTGCVMVRYENNKYEYTYEEAENCNALTITFNADGGTVSPVSKQVITGQTYGELPEPVKEGYTFMGWKIEGEASYITASTTVEETINHTLKAYYDMDDYAS